MNKSIETTILLELGRRQLPSLCVCWDSFILSFN